MVDAVRFHELEGQPAKNPAAAVQVGPVKADPAARVIQITFYGQPMDSAVLQFDRDVPLDLVDRPAVEKVWHVFRSAGPGRTFRPGALADAETIEIGATGVVATFPGNLVIHIPITRMCAMAGRPLTPVSQAISGRASSS